MTDTFKLSDNATWETMTAFRMCVLSRVDLITRLPEPERDAAIKDLAAMMLQLGEDSNLFSIHAEGYTGRYKVTEKLEVLNRIVEYMK